MVTYHKYEGKNETVLLEQYLKEFNENKDNIYFTIKEMDASLFKGKKYILEAISKDEIKENIKKYINDLSFNLNININCEIRFDDNTIKVMLSSDNNNIIIGSNGKNLDAIQILLRQVFKDLNKINLKILLDVSSYKEKKEKKFQKEIKNICKEILISKIEVKLDPMNSYQRRLVHEIVTEFKNLESYSLGVEPERYTVIKYKE